MKFLTRLLVLCLLLPGINCCLRAQNSVVSPLHVSASGKYFETADGHPWFWLGDTGWSLLTAYTQQETETYISTRADLGFTIVQVVAVWDGGTGTEKGINPNANTAGVQPWRNHDPLQPNEAYWKNVDALIATAAKNNMYIGLLPAWGSYVVNSKMITMANAEEYGRWLGQRYKHFPNVVWIVGGDRDVDWTAGADRESSDAVNVWRAIARGLQAGDGNSHLITFHPGGKLRNNQQERWLAADMIQTWAWYKEIPAQIAIDYSLKPTKPVILAEGAYEAGPEYPTGPITPLLVRRQAYWTYLSGAFFTYGHNDSWRKNPTWKASLTSEGARDMQVLRQLFGSLPWWELHPAQSLFVSGEGSGTTLNVAAISSDGTWAMVYLSTPSTAVLQLDQLHAGHLTATWIDPRTGERSSPKLTSRSGQSFTTPAGWSDAILLLQKNQ